MRSLEFNRAVSNLFRGVACWQVIRYSCALESQLVRAKKNGRLKSFMSAGADRIGKDSTGKGSSGKWAFMMVLFSTTIFVSAALLFLIEPMFAKFVLPSFGSTPAVWTGSMMFFQAALLVSYLYVNAPTTCLGARP